MFVVHVLRLLLGLPLGLLPVEPVLALGLGKFIDFGAGKSSEEFFGELVGDGLAYETVSI